MKKRNWSDWMFRASSSRNWNNDYCLAFLDDSTVIINSLRGNKEQPLECTGLEIKCVWVTEIDGGCV